MTYACVDVQLLRGRHGEWVVKEFGVFKSMRGGEYSAVVTFGPAYTEGFVQAKFKRQNMFTVENIHGLGWNEGQRPYETLRSTLECLAALYTVLYVKGLEKQRLLQTLLPDKRVYNKEDYGCPPFTKLPTLWAVCHNEAHNQSYGYKCAHANARKLGLWLEFHFASTSLA